MSQPGSKHMPMLDLTPLKEKHGFLDAQWIPLEKPLSFHFYRAWIDKKFHGEMNYLERHLPQKEDPANFFAPAKSVLSLLWSYAPQTEPLNSTSPPFLPALKKARIALYAQGLDYHKSLHQKMQTIVQDLALHWPEATFLPSVDTRALMERDLAVQARLGWVGKNTCLIKARTGSLFFISEILCSLEFPKLELEPLPDLCGTCKKCLEVCPTQALEAPRELNATKCISYLTIESRSLPPEPLRKAMGDWFFGCDLCQTVCPWNLRFVSKHLETHPQRTLDSTDRRALTEEMNWILSASGKALQKAFSYTALSRAGSFGLKRNALIVIANQKLIDCREGVQRLSSHPKLGELAEWTLKELDGNPHRL